MIRARSGKLRRSATIGETSACGSACSNCARAMRRSRRVPLERAFERRCLQAGHARSLVEEGGGYFAFVLNSWVADLPPNETVSVPASTLPLSLFGTANLQ